jgi:hypothetical protein
MLNTTVTIPLAVKLGLGTKSPMVTPLKVKASNDTAPFVDFELVVKDDLSGIDSGYVRAGNKKFDPLFYPCVGSFGKDSSDQVTPEFPAGIPLKFRIRMECDTFLPPIDYFMELFVSDGALNFLNLNSTDLGKRRFLLSFKFCVIPVTADKRTDAASVYIVHGI